MHAYCYRGGEIAFGQKVPSGAILLVTGKARLVRERVSARTRLSYDNRTLLVPGIPEAEDDAAAEAALLAFKAFVGRGPSLTRLTGASLRALRCGSSHDRGQFPPFTIAAIRSRSARMLRNCGHGD